MHPYSTVKTDRRVENTDLENAQRNIHFCNHFSEKHLHNGCCPKGRPVYHSPLFTVVGVAADLISFSAKCFILEIKYSMVLVFCILQRDDTALQLPLHKPVSSKIYKIIQMQLTPTLLSIKLTSNDFAYFSTDKGAFFILSDQQSKGTRITIMCNIEK